MIRKIFKRNILEDIASQWHEKTRNEEWGEEEIVTRHQICESSKSWSRQVKSCLNLTLWSWFQSREQIRLNRGGRIHGLEPWTRPWLYRNRKYGLLRYSWLFSGTLAFSCATSLFLIRSRFNDVCLNERS